MEKNTYIKISIFLIDIFFVLLGLLTIGLPFLITLYAEIMHRSSSLATTVMLTCYPCVPFVAITLFCLRRFLKGAAAGDVFSDENLKYLKNMAICCIVISLITLIAGFFYMPFFIVGATFGFMVLLVYTLRAVGKIANQK